MGIERLSRISRRETMVTSLRTVMLLASATALAACSGQDRVRDDQDADVAPDSSPDAAADADAHGDTDAGEAWPTHDSDIETPEDVPECGDGELDPGEECDDGNRLDGDGCDWLCRAWDGERPPEPDSTVTEYEPDGAPEPIESDSSSETDWFLPIPLAWSGGELATAIWETPGGSTEESQVRFRRFDRTGGTLLPDWTQEVDQFSVSMDLIWVGDGYGFFWADAGIGIYFLALDEHAKPVGEPRLVVDSEAVLAISAARSERGFALVWSEALDREIIGCNGRGQPSVGIWARSVGRFGDLEGLPDPAYIHESGRGLPDIARGEHGFGLISSVPRTVHVPECSTTFLILNEDYVITHAVGRLSRGIAGQVQTTDEGTYIAGWTPDHADDSPRSHICFGRFDDTGLLAAPVCDVTTGRADYSLSSPLFGVGDGGVFVLFTGNRHHHAPTDLHFARVDMRGRMIGGATQLNTDVLGCGVTWMDDSFAVLYLRYEATYDGALFFQRFVASP